MSARSRTLRSKVGSKTCNGLTYLERVLVDIMRLKSVSKFQVMRVDESAYKTAHEYLAVGLWNDSGGGRRGFGLPSRLGRLANATYGAGGSWTSSI